MRYARGLVLWFILCVAAAIVYIVSTPPEYYAASFVILEPRSSFSGSQGVDPGLLQTNLDNSQIESQIQIVKSERVLRLVFQTLNLQNDPEFVGPLPSQNVTPDLIKRHDAAAFTTFSDRVTVRRIGQSLVLEIGYRSKSAGKAASIANSVTAAFIRDQIDARSLSMQRNNEWLQGRIDEIKGQQQAIEEAVRKGVLPDRQFSASDARIISSATEPLSKSYPQTKLILLLAASFSLLTGLGAVSIFHTLNRTLRAKRHVQRELGLNCIGIVPFATDQRGTGLPHSLADLRQDLAKLPKTLTTAAKSLRLFKRRQANPGGNYFAYSTSQAGMLSPFSESLRAVRTAIMGKEQSSGARIIGIASCLPQEGKSTLAANLAHLFAAGGRHTMLIDCDLHDDALSRHYAPDARYGLSEVLQQRGKQITAAAVNLVPRLDFIPAKKAGSSADINLFIGSSVMQDQLSALSAYDCVIVDLPAMSLSSDVKAVAPLLDTVIFVIEAGRTTSDDVTEALDTLQQANGKVMGAVLNKVPRRDWPVLLRRPRH
ncbi:AAA family ATPase [Labrys sp. KNU-23]|uniref:BY-kinase domain-containing protein n=1 Tax=Labrys sp. KNU-23 TaxID=2789216 RepID=UPI00165A8A68|nr:AAA family ATPase [Labrys sp. KNU-23]